MSGDLPMELLACFFLPLMGRSWFRVSRLRIWGSGFRIQALGFMGLCGLMFGVGGSRSSGGFV